MECETAWSWNMECETGLGTYMECETGLGTWLVWKFNICMGRETDLETWGYGNMVREYGM